MSNEEAFGQRFVVPVCQSLAFGMFSSLAGLGTQHYLFPSALPFGGFGVLVFLWVTPISMWFFFSSVNGPPPVPRQLIQRFALEIKSDGGRTRQFLELPVDGERTFALAEGLAHGAPLTTSRWSGSRGIFSRSEFELVRDELVARGLARWRGGSRSQGIELTLVGKAIMRKIADEPPPLREVAYA